MSIRDWADLQKLGSSGPSEENVLPVGQFPIACVNISTYSSLKQFMSLPSGP